jgi:hypothetical protein
MKYDITQEDRDTILHDMQNDRTLKHLRNLSFYKFSIGDVLIKEEKYSKHDGTNTYEWKTSIAGCDLPYKYVYVFENELGVGYIRRLSVNGRKFVERPVCVTEFDPDQTRFVLDPEYADHMLLSSEDEAFDTKSRYDTLKKKREQIHRKNKKLRVQIADDAQAAAWMRTLKVGDQLWWGYSISNIYKEAYYVQSVDCGLGMVDARCSVKLTNVPGGGSQAAYGSTIYANNLTRYSVFMQKPTFVEDVIN